MNLWWGIGLLFTAMTGFALLVFGSFFSGKVKLRVPFYWFRSIFRHYRNAKTRHKRVFDR
ncbi:hypothetical protein B194_4339 [Serratia plymuthica A30]|nr:hypothetical protein B194_4339 [Serratia plymuthica A30]